MIEVPIYNRHGVFVGMAYGYDAAHAKALRTMTAPPLHALDVSSGPQHWYGMRDADRLGRRYALTALLKWKVQDIKYRSPLLRLWRKWSRKTRQSIGSVLTLWRQ